MNVLVGIDFFTVEVLTWRGLVTYYVLFFMELETRRVWIGGITRHPDACWMQQVARNATMGGCRLPEGVPLPGVRSRSEVLRGLPRDPGSRRRKNEWFYLHEVRT
jgi:hypothetical protein